MLALRLRIQNLKITEIETFIQRSPSSALGFEKIGYKWTQSVPPPERMSREDLIRTANMYFSGMQQNDGRGDYPFTDDCNRIENGGYTTNVPTPPGETRPDPKTSTNYSAQWSCMEQFRSGLLHFVTRIRDRRFVAVDPERGLVFSFTFFDHSAGDTRVFKVPDGRTVTAGPQQPWTWEIAELFQIEKGRIHQIQAIMERAPYGMNSGWAERQKTDASAQPDGGACKRTCLEGFVDRYSDALLAHNPAKAPLAANIKFTQNGQRLIPGDGLWRTMTAKGTYRLFVDDPEENTVAFLGTIREAGMPAILALRLKVQNGQISEVETFLVENQNAAKNLEKLGHPNPVFLETIPPAQRASRDSLIKA
ncbi:MAG: hypothetical protein ACRD2G_04675, partial [Terriglobia bacterium]